MHKQVYLFPLLIVGSLALAVAFTVYYQFNPSIVRNADAWGYVLYALRFREHYPFFDFGGVRTYGYPLFLYAVSFFSGTNPARLALSISIIQYSLFLLAVIWLAREAVLIHAHLALAVFTGLALNPVIISSVTDTLTEGLSIVAGVALAATILTASRQTQRLWPPILTGCMITAAAVVVRPGNIVLAFAWYGTLALWIARIFFAGREGARRLLTLTAGGAAISGILLFGPQVAYNITNFGKMSFLPACDLGGFQVYASAMMWKYDTLIMSDNQAAGLNYINPLLTGPISTESPFSWYYTNPVAGVATMAAHIFNLFSVTTLFSYVRDLHPTYDLPLRLTYWVVVIAGFWSGAKALTHHVAKREPRISNPLVYAALCVTGAIALNTITAVEQRFGVIPLAALSVAACSFALHMMLGKPAKLRIAILAALSGICTVGSYGMDRLAMQGYGDRMFEYVVSTDCKVTLDGKTWEQLFQDFDRMSGANPRLQGSGA